MKLNFKQSIWFQLEIPDELEDDIRTALVSTKIDDADKAIHLINKILPEDNINGIHNLDTVEQMKIYNNSYDSTIELVDYSGNIIWMNGD